MSSVIKKQDLTIVIREYTDGQGQQKKVYKTIGELITWQGDDGSQYQSFEMWGPTGSTQGKVFDRDPNRAQNNMQQVQQPQQPQQGKYMQNGQPMNPKQVQQQMHPDVPFMRLQNEYLI